MSIQNVWPAGVLILGLFAGCGAQSAPSAPSESCEVIAQAIEQQIQAELSTLSGACSGDADCVGDTKTMNCRFHCEMAFLNLESASKYVIFRKELEASEDCRKYAVNDCQGAMASCAAPLVGCVAGVCAEKRSVK